MPLLQQRGERVFLLAEEADRQAGDDAQGLIGIGDRREGRQRERARIFGQKLIRIEAEAASAGLLFGQLADVEHLAADFEVSAQFAGAGQQGFRKGRVSGVADHRFEYLDFASVGGFGETKTDIESQYLRHVLPLSHLIRHCRAYRVKA